MALAHGPKLDSVYALVSVLCTVGYHKTKQKIGIKKTDIFFRFFFLFFMLCTQKKVTWLYQLE